MKILSVIIVGMALAGIAGPASAGYRDLERDMEAYAPPAMLHQPDRSAPPVNGKPDDFEIEKKTLEHARDRWEKVVGETAAAVGGVDLQPAMIQAATDDARSLGLLRPRFSLEIAQSLILLRNPSIKAATDRLRGGPGRIRPGDPAG